MIQGSKICTPDARPETAFYDPVKAVAYLKVLYQDAIGFLQSRFDDVQRSGSTGPVSYTHLTLPTTHDV